MYNGYPNYETWCYMLWIDNEPNSYNWIRERAKEIFQHYKDNPSECKTFGAKNETIYKLAREIERDLEDLHSDNTDKASFWSDITMKAIQSVNCEYIAAHIIDEIE